MDNLTDLEVWTAIRALRVAATQYETDAQTNAAYPRVNRQFLEQATLAKALADRMEAQS
jgi:hypothetical protein